MSDSMGCGVFGEPEPEKKPDPAWWQKAIGFFFFIVFVVVVAVLLAAVGGVIARGVRWGLEGW